jgi:hypothetical protein
MGIVVSGTCLAVYDDQAMEDVTAMITGLNKYVTTPLLFTSSCQLGLPSPFYHLRNTCLANAETTALTQI